MIGRVAELVVRVPRPERRNRGIDGRRIAEPGVLVAGRESARHAAQRSRPQPAAARHPVPALLLGPEHPRGVDLRAGDVAVDVDPRRHHDIPPRVDRPIGLRIRDRPGPTITAVRDPEVPDFFVNVRWPGPQRFRRRFGAAASLEDLAQRNSQTW